MSSSTDLVTKLKCKVVWDSRGHSLWVSGVLTSGLDVAGYIVSRSPHTHHLLLQDDWSSPPENCIAMMRIWLRKSGPGDPGGARENSGTRSGWGGPGPGPGGHRASRWGRTYRVFHNDGQKMTKASVRKWLKVITKAKLLRLSWPNWPYLVSCFCAHWVRKSPDLGIFGEIIHYFGPPLWKTLYT